VKQSCDLSPFSAVIKSNSTLKSYHFIGRHHKRLFKSLPSSFFCFRSWGMAKIRLIKKPYNTSFPRFVIFHSFRGRVSPIRLQCMISRDGKIIRWAGLQKAEHAWPRGHFQNVIVLSGTFFTCKCDNNWNIINEIERNVIQKHVNWILIQL
jgi:hypothetical protein